MIDRMVLPAAQIWRIVKWLEGSDGDRPMLSDDDLLVAEMFGFVKVDRTRKRSQCVLVWAAFRPEDRDGL